MTENTSKKLIHQLELQPHPEGGWFREIYRSPSEDGERGACTAIYFLLEKNQVSRWHQVDADEIWHFYAGSPLELLCMDPNFASIEKRLLGSPLEGFSAMETIPAHGWQAARSTGDFTLVGCTVSPAFRFEGFSFLPSDVATQSAVLQHCPERRFL